jgi:hypothetical protein
MDDALCSVAPPHLDVASAIGCYRDVGEGDTEAYGDDSVTGFVLRNHYEKARGRAAIRRWEDHERVRYVLWYRK